MMRGRMSTKSDRKSFRVGRGGGGKSVLLDQDSNAGFGQSMPVRRAGAGASVDEDFESLVDPAHNISVFSNSISTVKGRHEDPGREASLIANQKRKEETALNQPLLEGMELIAEEEKQ